MRPCKYGIQEDDPGAFDLINMCADKDGRWLLIRGKREQLQLRITPSGLIRVGTIAKAGKLRADGYHG